MAARSHRITINMIFELSEVIEVTFSATTETMISVTHGSSANITQWRVLEQMKLIGNILPATKLLAGFNLRSVTTRGEIFLPTHVEGVTKTILFKVVDSDMGYNVILGRPWIHEMKVVPSTYHQLLKFPTPEGIKRIRGDQPPSREMNVVPRSFQVPEEKDATKSTAEGLEQVALFEDFLETKFHLGTRLSSELGLELINFLKANVDCFACSHSDMTSIPLEVAVHTLSLDLNFPPEGQKKRPIAEVRNRFGKEEVTRLLNIGSIGEVKYLD
uniref:Uncharacterized protein n=1 Tax=Nicotiana tabacum TaxID=4097 RepID=A0A1S3Y7Z1_TOBAC|nr:PREDICTED: uncharacterized protein LOC107773501 [Nicotiana tabacum]